MVSAIDLTATQQQILSALQSLPAGCPVKRVSLATNLDLSVFDMKPFIKLGLVQEVQRNEPPAVGFSLTESGDKLAALIREARHPVIRTPEMATQVSTVPLRERVSRDMLAQAIIEGRSFAWMALKFDASVSGIKGLIEEYGLDKTPPAAPVNPATKVEVQSQVSKYKWPADEELIRMADEIKARGGIIYRELSAKLDIPEENISARLAVIRIKAKLAVKPERPALLSQSIPESGGPAHIWIPGPLGMDLLKKAQGAAETLFGAATVMEPQAGGVMFRGSEG